jgi:DNA-binding NtrC family response regulator
MVLEKILVVGKGSEALEFARPFTRQLFAADDIRNIWESLDTIAPNLIILGTNTPKNDICIFLTDLKLKKCDTPVIVVGNDHDDHAELVLKLGACDYIKGTDDFKRLGLIIDNINTGQMTKPFLKNYYFAEDCPSTVSIVGKSKSTSRMLKMIKIVASSSCNPVLIIGETGTGKELAARAVHISRHGPDSKFVAVNCAVLTANLLESELFGHVKGAFTGADSEKTGLLEIADSGTIFLDEVSEMPLDLQAKLLRVVQEKTFRKVGGVENIKCNATIIASSNKILLREVENGKFRRDLYYRLMIFPVIISPLRAESRKNDILLLADYFIKNTKICPEKAGKIKGLTTFAMEALKKHLWMGNVRELRNVIERAVMLETNDHIGIDNLILEPEELLNDNCWPANNTITDFSLERAERELITKALNETGWQKTKAAEMLGITRATLYAKVKQYKIKQADEKQHANA